MNYQAKKSQEHLRTGHITADQKRRELKARKEADLAKISQKQKLNRKTGLETEAARFKLVGGPYHDMMVRLYAPWDDLVFPDGSTYELHPPLNKRSDRWVYVHKMEGTDEQGTAG